MVFKINDNDNPIDDFIYLEKKEQRRQTQTYLDQIYINLSKNAMIDRFFNDKKDSSIRNHCIGLYDEMFRKLEHLHDDLNQKGILDKININLDKNLGYAHLKLDDYQLDIINRNCMICSADLEEIEINALNLLDELERMQNFKNEDEIDEND